MLDKRLANSLFQGLPSQQCADIFEQLRSVISMTNPIRIRGRCIDHIDLLQQSLRSKLTLPSIVVQQLREP